MVASRFSAGRGRSRVGVISQGVKLSGVASRGASSEADLPVWELDVVRPAHGGVAIAFAPDGRVVFVRHAIPGERVRAQVTLEQKKIVWAEVIEVLSASADRVPCVWSEAGPGGVGGAELAHVGVQAQLRWKEEVLRDQLRRIGGERVWAEFEDLPDDVLRVRPTAGDAERADRLGWRSRVEFVVDSRGYACMHAYRGDRLIPVSDMPLAMPELLECGVLESNSVWSSLWKPGDRVRVVAQTGVVNPRVLVSVGEKVYEADGTLCEDPYVNHRVSVANGSFEYRVHMQGFWQAHRQGAQTLAQNVYDFAALRPGYHVLELYSGAGLFSSVLAEGVGPTGRVVTVEGSEQAVADASVNTGRYGNVTPFVGWIDSQAVRDAVDELGAVPDCVVLDPPRAGGGTHVCEAIASVGTKRVVLVSCDVAAGARDLKAFVSAGYRVVDARVWDLYPYTHHVEMIVLLSR